MGRTRKDSKQTPKTIIEVAKRPDETFDLVVNGKLFRNRIPERWLPDELCVRWGFCGEEYDAILRELNQKGRITISF